MHSVVQFVLAEKIMALEKYDFIQGKHIKSEYDMRILYKSDQKTHDIN